MVFIILKCIHMQILLILLLSGYVLTVLCLCLQVALLDMNAETGKSLLETLETKFGNAKTLFFECNIQSEEQLKAIGKPASVFVWNNAFMDINWKRVPNKQLLLQRIIIRRMYIGLGPLPGCPVYTATKYGVIGFTRSMAYFLLCPGFVDTSLFNHIPERLGQFVHMKETIMRVSRVAEGMMELVSDEKKTGEALIIMPKGNKYATFPTTVDL
uniref:Uncharacterized protein n=1 Tax=Periophthalmus magnuspinnatus TaxID=409849 RepID=A0A3B4AQS2_9GOBI